MKSMKKILTTLAVALSLTVATVAPTPAQAGVASILVSAANIHDHPVARIYSMAIGAAVVVGGVGLLHEAGPVGRALGIVLIVFDADASLSQDALANHLAETYPFIDNRETLNDLAGALKAKVDDAGALKAEMTVGLTENETRSLLASTELTEEQIQYVVLGLK
jgi:hypothetical protein